MSNSNNASIHGGMRNITDKRRDDGLILGLCRFKGLTMDCYDELVNYLEDRLEESRIFTNLSHVLKYHNTQNDKEVKPRVRSSLSPLGTSGAGISTGSHFLQFGSLGFNGNMGRNGSLLDLSDKDNFKLPQVNDV
jgi:hypothetical protein